MKLDRFTIAPIVQALQLDGPHDQTVNSRTR